MTRGVQKSVCHFDSSGEALVLVLRHSLLDDRVDSLRKIGVDLSYLRHRVRDVFDGDSHGCIGFIRLFACQHFEQDDTQRVNIGTPICPGAWACSGAI